MRKIITAAALSLAFVAPAFAQEAKPAVTPARRWQVPRRSRQAETRSAA